MNNNFQTRLIQGFLGIGLSACAVAAPAVAMPLAQGFSQVGDRPLLLNVKMQNQRMTQQWNQHRHGNRCMTRMSNCNHFHRGFYYQTPWWTLPLIIGQGLNNQQMMNGSSGHVRWCMSRYRSYNIRSDSFMGNDGRRHRCSGPY